MSVEVDLIDWLNGDPLLVAESFEASLDIPEQRPARFITVERTGGPESRFIGSPTLAVQVWAKYRFEAADFAGKVAKSIRAAVALPHFARVNVSSIYNFPDPDSGHARYQLTVEVISKVD